MIKQEELSQSRLEFPCSIRSISTVAPPALTGCAIRRNDGIPVGISLQSNDIIVHDGFLCHMPLSARRKIFRDLPLCPLEIINNASHLQANRVSPSFVIRPMIFHFRFLRNIHVHLVHSLHFFEFTFERSATIYVIWNTIVKCKEGLSLSFYFFIQRVCYAPSRSIKPLVTIFNLRVRSGIHFHCRLCYYYHEKHLPKNLFTGPEFLPA